MSANSHRPPSLDDFVARAAAPEGTVAKVISRGFYTCGAACPNPRACMADEHCERCKEPALTGTARALGETAATSNQLTATYEALRAAIKPFGDKLREEQHAKRDAEWQTYRTAHLPNPDYNNAALTGMHDAFNAGWDARKKVELAMVYGLDTPRKA